MQDFTVAVKLKLVNEISAGLLVVSKDFVKLNNLADKFHTKLTQIKSLMSTGASLMTGGFALAAPFIYAISKAAELQKQMIGIQIATHGTTAEMNTMRLAIEKASTPTQFSAITVSQIAKQVATSNSFNATQLTSLLPVIAKFADVQALLKGTDPMSSATDAVKMMHLAQKYSPKDVEPYFDMITKTSLMMPGGIGELRSALSYFQPMGKSAMGVGDKDSLMLVALLSRLGLSGSRGGTNLLAAMTRTIPGIFGSGLMKGKSGEALNDMGFIDKSGHSIFMENGKFDSQEWVKALAATAARFIKEDPKHGRERFMKDYQHAFGTQGGKVAGLFSSDQSIDQLAQMNDDFSQLASMGVIQDKYVNESVSQQFTSAMTNFQNAMIELGTTLLPATSKGLNMINNELKPMIAWMQSHQQDVKNMAMKILSVAGLMGAGGALYIAFSALMALTSPIGMVSAAIVILNKEFWKIADAIKNIINIWSTFHAQNPNVTVGNVATTAANMVGSKLSQVPGLVSTSQLNKGSGDVVVHSHLFLDSHQVAQAVTKVQAKQATQQPAHGSFQNPGMSLPSNMNNQMGQ